MKSNWPLLIAGLALILPWAGSATKVSAKTQSAPIPPYYLVAEEPYLLGRYQQKEGNAASLEAALNAAAAEGWELLHVQTRSSRISVDPQTGLGSLSHSTRYIFRRLQ
ncbi:MAG: hypothetical protein KDK99_05125 [Verrucomicrobiales bacterium]|nr:hypothetical protein [Verrucomicrobiales bacterium]